MAQLLGTHGNFLISRNLDNIHEKHFDRFGFCWDLFSLSRSNETDIYLKIL